jgi:hypothetical protein
LNSLPTRPYGPFLFSTTAGLKPLVGFSRAKIRLDALMVEELSHEADCAAVELPDWTIHDLRRTARTHFSALPVPEVVRELLLAHKQKGLHAVYDQYSYLEEKRTALELWAARLRPILEPLPDNVLQFN